MGKLPLNDPRWCSMQAAVDLRNKQTGDLGVAILDLEQAMESGKLRSMCRNRASNERKLVPASFWEAHVIDNSHPGVVTIYRGTDIDHTPQRFGFFAHRAENRIDGWLFYAWMPDLDRLYSGSARADHDDNDSPPPVKPGKKPTGDWPTLIGQWLIARAVDDPQRLQNVDELVIEAKIFLHNRIKWAPKEDKELRAKIRELLELVRR